MEFNVARVLGTDDGRRKMHHDVRAAVQDAAIDRAVKSAMDAFQPNMPLSVSVSGELDTDKGTGKLVISVETTDQDAVAKFEEQERQSPGREQPPAPPVANEGTVAG
jgi:hypothetical protein